MMWGWFFGKKLADAVHATVRIRVHGVWFRIRKINPLDYLQGGKAMRQIFDTYKVHGMHNLELTGNQARDIKAHYADVFLASVVEPKLKRTAEDAGEGMPVEHLFTDWDLSNELYQRILEYTFGKKKLRMLLISQKNAALKSTP